MPRSVIIVQFPIGVDTTYGAVSLFIKELPVDERLPSLSAPTETMEIGVSQKLADPVKIFFFAFSIQLVVISDLRNILIPSLEGFVNGHARVEDFQLGRNRIDFFAHVRIAHAQFYLFESRQRIQLGNRYARQPVYAGRIPDDNRVKPSAAAGAARGRAILKAFFPEVIAGFIGQLVGKGPLPTRVVYALAMPITS